VGATPCGCPVCPERRCTRDGGDAVAGDQITARRKRPFTAHGTAGTPSLPIPRREGYRPR
ncbi:MAG TPA: hypothetical protein PLS55_04035, partial [Thermogutta sp.]|nr:hypothetical protein [Thermogutta sp.]